MHPETLEEELRGQIEKMKDFLTSKNVFTFLLYLAISASLWALNALNKRYETMVEVPVEYVGIPNGYVLSQEPIKSLHITVTGQGTNLVKYRWGRNIPPLRVKLQGVERGAGSMPTQSFLSALQKQGSNADVQITKISPDSIYFCVERLAEKTLPVEVCGTFDLAQQYTYCDTMTHTPSTVTAYGPQSALDSLSVAKTRYAELSDIKDTQQVQVMLERVPLVIFSDSVINLTFQTERFTEKKLQAPLSIVNLPHDRVLRIFPANVEVSCKVGFSHYETLDAASFTFFVDYADIAHSDGKIAVQWKELPQGVFGLKTTPQSVDYIVEEKNGKE